MRLNKALPFAAVTFTIAIIASMGIPGFSGFVAELQVLIGAWYASPTFAVLAGLGILVGVAYSLRVLQKAFFADVETDAGAAAPVEGNAPPHCTRISAAERVGAILLIAATLVIGLYPRLLLDLINPSFNSTLFDGLRKGGGF
jgi:NADH-quinone oxidoreductase subunit M